MDVGDPSRIGILVGLGYRTLTLEFSLCKLRRKEVTGVSLYIYVPNVAIKYIIRIVRVCFFDFILNLRCCLMPISWFTQRSIKNLPRTYSSRRIKYAIFWYLLEDYSELL